MACRSYVGQQVITLVPSLARVPQWDILGMQPNSVAGLWLVPGEESYPAEALTFGSFPRQCRELDTRWLSLCVKIMLLFYYQHSQRVLAQPYRGLLRPVTWFRREAGIYESLPKIYF